MQALPRSRPSYRTNEASSRIPPYPCTCIPSHDAAPSSPFFFFAQEEENDADDDATNAAAAGEGSSGGNAAASASGGGGGDGPLGLGADDKEKTDKELEEEFAAWQARSLLLLCFALLGVVG